MTALAPAHSPMRDELRIAVNTPLPAPGGGSTAERFRSLAGIARDDLEVARLAEAHHDACAIAAELGSATVDGALYGVWAASGPDPLTIRRTANGWAVSGTVPWCSGVGIVDRALLTARVGEDPAASSVLLDLAVEDGRPGAGARPWASPAFMATGTSEMHFDCTVPATAIIGAPGQYLSRPGFWHGAIGVAACWAGGLQGLLDLYLAGWHRDDPHALAHLGSAVAWTSMLDAVLSNAGDEIDAAPDNRDAAEARARSVRHVVERTCTTVTDDLGVGAGPQMLAFDLPILQRTQQLQLYVRQCHGERDLEPLGRAARLRSTA